MPAIFRTGTGGACAPLSEILPAARVARYVRMTQESARFGTKVWADLFQAEPES
ncbi:MAG TPA: hypothetical protein VJX68_02860 [Candidatus Binatus sp.]|uniref:hypothetical protein n=1 Tax=Candidatus Binatus sp. TaxID=2811406 RepID=UPI002B478D58|nr:hypothetical protein [Candidatus Binatus sp.]HKN12111.1 hypothetical protein [Candidatus Binatus sp.]